jgi:hypothetical protein
MRNLLPLMLIFAAACGGDDDATDAAVAKLDCPSYCSQIQANCTGANAQYADDAHCTGACNSFAAGTLGQMTGNTLGCRLYHSGAPAKMDAATHCPHAGPGGDKIGGTGTCGDVCTSFCTMEIRACGMTGDAGGNGQYTSMTDCMTKCAAFPNPTALYSPTAKGDSLACRLYHATNASISGMAATHCPHTGPNGGAAQATCMTGTATM